MPKADSATIEYRATQFRRALEQSNIEFLPTLANFPNGSCGDATLLLARFLRDSGLGVFDYVCGEVLNDTGGFQSHAWLQREQLIVDITADQFEDVDTPVIVTENHAWHSRFQSVLRNVADWDLYDQRTTASLASAYERIVSVVDETQQSLAADGATA